MYTYSNKLKTFSFILIILGVIGVAYGFISSNKSLEDVKTLIAQEAAHHGSDHAEGTHVLESQGSHGETDHASADVHHDDEHAEHVMHQISNRPWAALYVAAFFFMMIALGVLAFYAIQFASQAGWSPVLFRVMEGITAYLLPGVLIVLAIALASGTIGHYNLFIWMDPEVVAHDKLIQGKSSFLNIGGFAIRGIIFIAGWWLYRHFSRKFSIAQDNADDISNYKKTFR